MLAYNRAVNAEAYHCGQAEEFGYITMEAIQFFFGDAVIKAAGGVLKGNKVAKGARVAEEVANSVSNLSIRTDIVLSGGRSGQLVKTLTGPANSVVKGSQGRIFITDKTGKVIWDITKYRAKSVIPGQGFGPKVTPIQEHLNLLKQVWGN
jgi:hypothetical protein